MVVSNDDERSRGIFLGGDSRLLFFLEGGNFG